MFDIIGFDKVFVVVFVKDRLNKVLKLNVVKMSGGWRDAGSVGEGVIEVELV